HRMLDFQSAELQKLAPYRKLFRDAFPEEAAQAAAKGDLNLLINDITVLRATATFMRTAVTRDTPWDRFLAGDNRALSLKHRREGRGGVLQRRCAAKRAVRHREYVDAPVHQPPRKWLASRPGPER